MITSPIECSLYKPDTPHHGILIYCHSYGGNKIEGKRLLPSLLEHFSVLVFDFAGCGNSDGKYVTLGINESKDLAQIMQAVHFKFGTTEIYLWGRCMGSTAILHTLFNFFIGLDNIEDNNRKIEILIKETDVEGHDVSEPKRQIERLKLENEDTVQFLKLQPLVRGVVLDSPFPSAKELVVRLIKSRIKANMLTAGVIMFYIKKSLRNKIGKDVITDNHPANLVEFLDVPAVFMLGDGDTLIEKSDFIGMFDNYASDSKTFRLLVDTDHSAERAQEDVEFCVRFLHEIQLALAYLHKPVNAKDNYSAPEEVFSHTDEDKGTKDETEPDISEFKTPQVTERERFEYKI